MAQQQHRAAALAAQAQGRAGDGRRRRRSVPRSAPGRLPEGTGVDGAGSGEFGSSWLSRLPASS